MRGLGEVGGGDQGTGLIDDNTLGMEAGASLAIAGERARVVEDLGQALAGPDFVAEAVRELSQKQHVRGFVAVLAVDVHEQFHAEVKFCVHPLGKGSEKGFGLVAAVQGVARDQNALARRSEQLLHDNGGVAARASQHFRTGPNQRHPVGNGLGAVFDAGGRPDLGIIFKPEILGPIIGLAVLSLVPIIYKRLKSGGSEPASPVSGERS